MNLFRHLSLAAADARRFLRRHPRSAAAAFVAALAGGAATSFGVAPGTPDAADLPQRVISETVVPEGLQTQLDALAQNQLELSRTDLTRASDTADSLLHRLGVDDPAAAAFLRTDHVARRLFDGRAGKMVEAEADAEGNLKRLVARYPADNPDDAGTRFTRLTVSEDTTGAWSAKTESVPLAFETKLGSGTIQSSLFAATDGARLPDGIASQLVDMFGNDIDFHRQLHRGDTFSVVYQALTADGEPITWNQGAGQILAAQFVNNGHAYQSMWYRDPAAANAKGAYFGFDGQSKHPAFLASPLAFSRVTSGFSMRFHLILQQWKQHLGVDYGAPIGTPVRVVGDGTVSFAGVQNGYGNVIMVQHSGDRMTVYAHLSHIGVRKGQHVAEGDCIGNVGMTGWATGPHLHFEFRVHGQHQDPLTLARTAETSTVSPASRAQFMQEASALHAELTAAESMAGARPTFE